MNGAREGGQPELVGDCGLFPVHCKQYLLNLLGVLHFCMNLLKSCLFYPCQRRL